MMPGYGEVRCLVGACTPGKRPVQGSSKDKAQIPVQLRGWEEVAALVVGVG